MNFHMLMTLTRLKFYEIVCAEANVFSKLCQKVAEHCLVKARMVLTSELEKV